MKSLLALLVLTTSMGVMAQERVLLNSKKVSVSSSSAVLVRTSRTPNKVVVTFQVPMVNSGCIDSRTDVVHQICTRHENVYDRRNVCRDVVRTTPAPAPSNSPRGPRYNPTPTTRTERVCTTELVRVGSRPVAYDCSYARSYCAQYAPQTTTESDKVRIKFKGLPKLGGSEEETFTAAARQNRRDDGNVVYDILPLETLGREYKVESKGILQIDSYVIRQK